MMVLRTATPDDAGWVREQYEKAGFIPSDLARETVVVAELDGNRAGLGRLVPAGENAYELGGMYVDDAYRGRGVARGIVDELVRRAEGKELYCVPFANLETMYAESGFRRVEPVGIPEKVREKLDWCAANIPDRAVIVMKLSRVRPGNST